MSDFELGMKMVEEHDLGLFLAAYADATGERLEVVGPSERPDFHCRRETGSPVGIELTSAMRDPERVVADQILSNEAFADPYDAVARILGAIAAKEAKRTRGDWACRDNTILVLQVDCLLSDLAKLLEDQEPEDLSGHGFEEIWLADHSEVDAYDAVELFCLYPEDLWGHYERDRGKPYG